MDCRQICLVTGPARSGKSEWAEALATHSGHSVIYIATSTLDPADLDWQRRVALHRDRRPPHWHLQEVPIALPEAILVATAGDCLLIDSLGTWLANLLEQDDVTWQVTLDALIARLRQTAWEKELSPSEAASLALAWVAADRAACHGAIAEAAGALLDAMTEAPAE